MREKEIEKYLREEIKKLGGIAYKFTSPGNSGVPDRLVLLPCGIMAFVELKAPGGKTTAIQDRQIARIQKLDFDVYIVNSKFKVDCFIQDMQRRIGDY